MSNQPLQCIYGFSGYFGSFGSSSSASLPLTDFLFLYSSTPSSSLALLISGREKGSRRQWDDESSHLIHWPSLLRTQRCIFFPDVRLEQQQRSRYSHGKYLNSRLDAISRQRRRVKEGQCHHANKQATRVSTRNVSLNRRREEFGKKTHRNYSLSGKLLPGHLCFIASTRMNKRSNLSRVSLHSSATG